MCIIILRILFTNLSNNNVNRENSNVRIQKNATAVSVQTGTFFCVTTTAEFVPRTATDVIPAWFIALNAYSAKHWHTKRTSKMRIKITKNQIKTALEL